MVQDAWLRWRGAEPASTEPAAWLVRVTTRLCLDRLRADRAERAAYRGPWLPEPLIEEIAEIRSSGPRTSRSPSCWRSSGSRRWSGRCSCCTTCSKPTIAAIAETLDRSEAACRQLAARARAHAARTPARASRSSRGRGRAAGRAPSWTRPARNDLTALKALLAEDAVMITDGGGKRKAALRPAGRPPTTSPARSSGLIWRGAIPLRGPDPSSPASTARSAWSCSAADEVADHRLRAGRGRQARGHLHGAQPGEAGAVHAGARREFASERSGSSAHPRYHRRMRFDERFLDEIKSRLRLSDVIGRTREAAPAGPRVRRPLALQQGEDAVVLRQR